MGDSAEHSKGECSKEHTLLICEQQILWAEGAWIKTCRRIKVNPGVYMWAQVMLEIRGRLWAVMTVSFFTSTTPVAVLFQVMREASSSMVLWGGRQPQELEALQMNSIWLSL